MGTIIPSLYADQMEMSKMLPDNSEAFELLGKKGIDPAGIDMIKSVMEILECTLHQAMELLGIPAANPSRRYNDGKE